MSLTTTRNSYKPFEYPWAFEAWEAQQQMHWLPAEVPMGEDVKDWATKLTDAERNLLTQVFRFFTQADVEVNNCYMQHYSRVFLVPEVQMMLAAFSNMETVHIAAYSYLLDTLGMPESEYAAFRQYKEMRDKHDFLQSWGTKTPAQTVRTLAVFGAFTEGLQLFASFAILMNFPRFGKLKGMGQIITWSIRDETLHANSIIKLYHTFLAEHPKLNNLALRLELTRACQKMVELEDAFIDLAFEAGGVEGLSAAELKGYIRHVANHRLGQLNIDPIYSPAEAQPLPWLDEIIGGQEHTNFFENRATEYARGASTGSWEDAFDEPHRVHYDFINNHRENAKLQEPPPDNFLYVLKSRIGNLLKKSMGWYIPILGYGKYPWGLNLGLWISAGACRDEWYYRPLRPVHRVITYFYEAAGWHPKL